jgi:iron complex transport system substrate-binding protein
MRILSLAPSNTEIIYRLDAGDELVATTSLCNHPEEALEKPSIGGWTNPKIKRVKEFEPDLILASDDLQDRAVERLESEGLEVLQVRPHSLKEVYESFRKIGEAIEREEEAEELVEEMKSELESISLENSPRIYCEEWMDPPMVSGNWIPDLIREIGGEYFIEEGRSREFEVRDLKDFDPEYIFFNICGAGENLEPREIISNRKWDEITAVKKGNINELDDSLLNRPGPRLVEGARLIEKFVENN